MWGRFFIFVVLVGVIQNSLAIRTTTATQIQTDTMADYSTIEAFRQIAHSEAHKLNGIIFNLLENLVNEACGCKNIPEYTSPTTNISRAEASAALFTRFEVTFLAIQTIQPTDYSKISSVQATLRPYLQKSIDNIFAAIGFAQSKNSSGNVANIEAIYNEAFAAAPALNAIFYDTLRSGKGYPPRIESTISSAEAISIAQFRISARYIYSAIEAVATLKNQSGCNNVSVIIESARHQESAAVDTDVETRFGLLQRLLVGLSIIQNGIVAEFSVIQAIKMSAISDYEKALNSISIMTHGCSTQVTPENRNRTVGESSAIQDLENVAHREVQKAISMIFEMIINIDDASSDYDNQCVTEDNYSIIETGKGTGYIAFKTEIDSYFKAILIAEPGASSAVADARTATLSVLRRVIKGVVDGIKLIFEKNANNISARIEAIEQSTISDSTFLIIDRYIALINAQESPTRTGTAIGRAQAKTISIIKEIYRLIFIGIKIRLSQAFPEYRLEGEDCSSSIEDVENQVSSLSAELVDAEFDAVRILLNASSENQMENEEDSCTYTR